MRDGPLERRSEALRAIAAGPLDVLVIGGGIVGCGALLDATSRGLRAALVERDDIAAGTSSRSSRLIHGGLRYLEQFRVGLVREALAERARLLRLAPHLVRLEPLLFPLIGRPVVTRAFFEVGMTLYDLLGANRDGGRHRHLSVAEALDRSPALRPTGLRGGLLFHDGVEDDARFALAVARTAMAAGAIVATRVSATGMIVAGGRVIGARLRDELGGDTFDARAASVVDATGPWAADRTSPLATDRSRLLPSRGAHLVVRRERIPGSVGMTIRVPGKVVFLVPWPGHWLIGTTDGPHEGPIDRPTASGDEVDELLGAVNRVLDVDLQRDDLVGTYAGIRPLVAPAGGSTVRASREHRVVVEPNGLVRIGGGKYTTYRVMARDAIDAAVRTAARGTPAPPSRTADLRLIGAADRADFERLGDDIARRHGLDRAAARHLVDRYGTEADDVAASSAAAGRGRPLGPGIDHLEGEVAWAVERELALSLDDVLARRMRLAQQLPDRGASIAPTVAAIMASRLGWDVPRQADEVARYLASAQREFGVPAARPAP